MIQKISIFMLITIIIFFPQSYAPWSQDNVYIPSPDTTHTCKNWIIYSGFEEYDTKGNTRLAISRDRRLDDVVSVWAVLYAHFLLAFPVFVTKMLYNDYTPFKHCKNFMLEDSKLPFDTFQNFEKTCEEWVQIYGYSNVLIGHNRSFAKHRNVKEDGLISVWAAVYGAYISSTQIENGVNITHYCNAMVDEDKKMHFISLNKTKMSCQAWIKLSGYNDNIETNIKKAKEYRKNFGRFELSINRWTRLYIKHLHKSTKSKTASRFFPLFRLFRGNTETTEDKLESSSSGTNKVSRHPIRQVDELYVPFQRILYDNTDENYLASLSYEITEDNYLASSSSETTVNASASSSVKKCKPNIDHHPRTPLDYCTCIGYSESSQVKYNL